MKDLQHSFRNSDEYSHDPEKCEHAGPKYHTRWTSGDDGDMAPGGSGESLLLSDMMRGHGVFSLYICLRVELSLGFLRKVMVSRSIAEDPRGHRDARIQRFRILCE
ncbi:hypothetical protein Tco_0343252 [Tanacetum coccineum]